MILNDAVSLYAEPSVGLAGFAGVVAAFAGRERLFRPVERIRLIAVVVLSGSVLAGCLTYITATIAEFSAGHAISVAALVSFLVSTPLGVLGVPVLWQRAQAADATVDPWSKYLITLVMLVEIFLFAAAVLAPGTGWKLALGFSLQLVHALYLFMLLLTRPN